MKSKELSTMYRAIEDATYNATWSASWDAVCPCDSRANVTWTETFDVIGKKAWTVLRDAAGDATTQFLHEL